MLVCFGTISPFCPSLPARLVPHGLPGIGETQGQGQQYLWGNILGPAKVMVRVSLQSTQPLTFLPCSPGGPRGPCRGE